MQRGIMGRGSNVVGPRPYSILIHMCHPSVPEFPPNVVVYVRQEIARRTQYKVELETMPTPPPFRRTLVKSYNAEQLRLKENIAYLTEDILAIVKKHMPSIAIDPNDEVTISNILAALPPPDKVERRMQISARGM